MCFILVVELGRSSWLMHIYCKVQVLNESCRPFHSHLLNVIKFPYDIRAAPACKCPSACISVPDVRPDVL